MIVHDRIKIEASIYPAVADNVYLRPTAFFYCSTSDFQWLGRSVVAPSLKNCCFSVVQRRPAPVHQVLYFFAVCLFHYVHAALRTWYHEHTKSQNTRTPPQNWKESTKLKQSFLTHPDCLTKTYSKANLWEVPNTIIFPKSQPPVHPVRCNSVPFQN